MVCEAGEHAHHLGGVLADSVGAAIVAFGEALALGDTLGLERSALLDVLADSPIGSTVRAKRANVESDSYPLTLKLSLALRTFAWSTRSTRDWLERAANSGAGDLDYSAVIAAITDGGRSPA